MKIRPQICKHFTVRLKTYSGFFLNKSNDNSGRALCKSGKVQGSSGRAQDRKGRAQHPQKYA